MDNILQFIKNNIWELLIGLIFYAVFLQFTYSGNRLCDCESTEKYNSTSSGNRTSYNRFYHK